MTNYFNVPGLGSSGPQHWQTFFEKNIDNILRIEQDEWESPNCAIWVDTIEKKLLPQEMNEVVLIGHSLGCSAIAHWAGKYNKTIKGALLVAPSDPEALAYDFPVTGFAPLPLEKLNFKSIVVASSNDPWVSLERAAFFAECWGSLFINIGHAGHINAASGHGDWQEGLEFLKRI